MSPAAGHSTEDVTDEELVARMQRGDRAALALLYTRHAPAVLALVRAIVGDSAESEDVLHDVFLEAWRHVSSYEASRGSVKVWLSVRARSRSLDRLKSKRRRRDVLAAEAAQRPQEPIESQTTTLDPAERSSLWVALSGIQAAQREVLELGYFQDLSSTEIAERLNLPIGTVKSRTRAALSALRGMLEGKL
ncbi:MAG: sigma-70 family RNA polymerase sigma factor [Polyangiaceae bacterium]|nr:sigma-70 family RNA polymerase sigma factor [Polyangiaceae bacterium]